MTDEAASRLAPEALGYAEAWAESAGKVLGQIAGGAPLKVLVLKAAPAAGAALSESDLCLLASCSGGLQGEMSLHLPPAIALNLAQLFMADTPDPASEFKAEYREALEELFRQVVGHVVTTLKPKWGEVQIKLEAGPAPSWPAAATAWLATEADAAGKLHAEIRLSAALSAALRPGETAAASDSVGTLAVAAAAPPTAANPAALFNLPPDVKLDMLLEVELAATLRFGSRRMLLRDILDLNAGAVVELDRQVADPVDLLLDGRLIARGQVVVVDGNYGMRVTEMVAPEAAPGA